MFYMRFWQAAIFEFHISVFKTASVLCVKSEDGPLFRDERPLARQLPAAPKRSGEGGSRACHAIALATAGHWSLLSLFLGESEALRLFAASLAFPNIISALAVSHKS